MALEVASKQSRSSVSIGELNQTLESFELFFEAPLKTPLNEIQPFEAWKLETR